MSLVKEFFLDKTKIRIHNDYIKDEEKIVKETIISLMINCLEKKNI